MEFLPRWENDLIREGSEKGGKILGHYCRIKVIKSTNENSSQELRYPIRYGRKNAQSVWVEREIGDLLLAWELIEKKGSWLKFNPQLVEEIKNGTGQNLPEQVQGIDKIYTILEENMAIRQFLFDKFLALVCSSQFK